MNCYNCFKEYTQGGRICECCLETCCNECWMNKLIIENHIPQCGFCNYKHRYILKSNDLMVKVIPGMAKRYGFTREEGMAFLEEYKKWV